MNKLYPYGPYELDIVGLQSFVQGAVVFLKTKLVREDQSDPLVAGWHNFFTPDRIGTTGSAVPMILFNELKIDFEYRDAVIQKLLASQQQYGGWAILSVEDTASVEGTAWPLLALAVVGDCKQRSNLLRAEDWLVAQQHINGGWGSNKENAPRTLLTAITIEALSSLSAPSRDVITRGINWLSQHQRKDGSWGKEPGQDGEVFHTALVTRILLKSGLSVSDPRVLSAIEYLKKNWQPDEKHFFQEIYEFRVGAKYSRVILEHDVDAEVILCLLSARSIWSFEKLFLAVEGLVKPYTIDKSLHPPGIKPSIWNTVPRALAVAEFITHISLTGSGKVSFIAGLIVHNPNSSRFTTLKVLFGLLSTPLSRFLKKYWLLLLFLIIVIGAVIFYIQGTVTLQDLWLSIGGGIAVSCLFAFFDTYRNDFNK
jgi:Squalene-hopene cyclase C-terminal domain